MRPRLLIVDDSPVALAFLEAMFKAANFDVDTAGGGQEGIDKAIQSPPDLIVTDGLMPDIDGFDLIRHLRDHAGTAAIPVVMLTSGDFLDTEYTSRVPQPTAFVAKSMQFEPLMKQVKALLTAEPTPL